jgi:hypothetical protein
MNQEVLLTHLGMQIIIYACGRSVYNSYGPPRLQQLQLMKPTTLSTMYLRKTRRNNCATTAMMFTQNSP